MTLYLHIINSTVPTRKKSSNWKLFFLITLALLFIFTVDYAVTRYSG